MSGGNAVFIEVTSGMTLLLSPTSSGGLRVKIAEQFSSKWVVVTSEQEKLILGFLLMRAPRAVQPSPKPEAVLPVPMRKNARSWWTPERRAAHAEKMRAIRLATLAKKDPTHAAR